jgi:hypothetical protein
LGQWQCASPAREDRGNLTRPVTTDSATPQRCSQRAPDEASNTTLDAMSSPMETTDSATTARRHVQPTTAAVFISRWRKRLRPLLAVAQRKNIIRPQTMEPMKQRARLRPVPLQEHIRRVVVWTERAAILTPAFPNEFLGDDRVRRVAHRVAVTIRVNDSSVTKAAAPDVDGFDLRSFFHNASFLVLRPSEKRSCQGGDDAGLGAGRASGILP